MKRPTIDVLDSNIYDYHCGRDRRTVTVRKTATVSESPVYTRGDREAWSLAVVFPRTFAGYRAAIAVRNDWGVQERQSGAGMSFTRGAWIMARGSRVVVYQNGGLDV